MQAAMYIYLGNDDSNEKTLHCLRVYLVAAFILLREVICASGILTAIYHYGQDACRFRKASGVRGLAEPVVSVQQVGHLTRHAGELKQRIFALLIPLSTMMSSSSS